MEEKIEELWREVREVSLGSNGSIERLESPPTPLQFLKNFINPNKPCIISNSINHWPALSSWTDPSYLTQTLSSSTVSLHLTPTGAADSITSLPSSSSLCFASAHVERVPFPDALRLINSSDPSKCVAYAQQQNDCFRSEYSSLAEDCDSHIGWATEAFGSEPEAVNLWIGNRHSNTSFHKDHYENLYAVVTGEKRFLLFPPTDVHRFYIRHYPAATYKHSLETGEFDLELEKPTRYVPWCSVDPFPSPENLEDEISKFPLYFNGPPPFECTVKAGEILYLPSMWFHHVRQSGDGGELTIAVNYWYDMQFDIKYAYFNFLQSIDYQSPTNPTMPETLCEEIDSGLDGDDDTK
ncbi:lysine-specific demethylase JMJ32 isoform X3 [Lathyrus oleraceus]|uniref:lysine-specific demethylase JMJ32 isoform X2 n=1 Tax=Pisum sativum TaxID=3888 RepID=UPI0021D2A2D4|nr:lysine-specific demethylase JMJ32 isoform X2 [Pisum sativum]XP_050906267.1 lysine-specific demethylase JMJ32 isoform X3 [Pisum sativum]